jgi:hypothetical protein
MKDSYTNKVGLAPAGASEISKAPARPFGEIMNLLIKTLTGLGLLKKDLDYHLVRASMVIIYFFFGRPGGQLVLGGFRNGCLAHSFS